MQVLEKKKITLIRNHANQRSAAEYSEYWKEQSRGGRVVNASTLLHLQEYKWQHQKEVRYMASQQWSQ